jgi:hypothetical protein
MTGLATKEFHVVFDDFFERARTNEHRLVARRDARALRCV